MRITCAGDCGVDRYINLDHDRPGGKTLNVAVAARRCFAPSDRVGIISAVGTDPEAQLVRAAIDRFALDACVARLDGPTSMQYIDQHPSGEKIFVRYEQGVLGEYRIGDRERRLIARSDLLVTALYAEIHGFFRSVIEAPSSGRRVVDFSDLSDCSRPVEIVARYLERFDVGFFGLSSTDGELIGALERLAERHGKLFVVTLGADGSLALGKGTRITCAAAPVGRIVDTTGAGDVFAAGFLGAYGVAEDVRAGLEAGSRLAAVSLQHLGAFPI